MLNIIALGCGIVPTLYFDKAQAGTLRNALRRAIIVIKIGQMTLC